MTYAHLAMNMRDADFLFKCFVYYCPHMRGPVQPWGFCWKGTKGENDE